jgi:hypothetical protein
MTWPWRLIIIVPAEAKAEANACAAAIDYGNTSGGDAFGIALSSTAADPPTHYGIYISATDDMVAAMADFLPLVVGAQYWRHDAARALVASNVTEAANQQWGWAESLAAVGLTVIPPEFP